MNTMMVRETLSGFTALTHHEPDMRSAYTATQARQCITTPEVMVDIHLHHDGAQKFAFPGARVWIARDGIPTGGAPAWMEALDDRFGPDGDFHDGTVHTWRLVCQIAHSMDKKFYFVIGNEYHTFDPQELARYGQFTADVITLLVEQEPGAAGIIGNFAMGTIDQDVFDAFMVPDLVAHVKAGNAVFGIHDGYCYTAAPAGLMKYVAGDGEEWNHLAPNFMGPLYEIIPGSANQPAKRIPLPPIPKPGQYEGHLLGRFFSYVNVPPWLPIFITEAGAEMIGVQQAKEWGAPFKDDRGDGIEGIYSGIVDIKSLINRTWVGADNASAWYVHKFMSWVNDFYAQWDQVFAVDYWCRGDNYQDPDDPDSGWAKYDMDRLDAGLYLNGAIQSSSMIEIIPPHNWAAHVLSQPPTEPPPHEPPPDPIYILPYSKRLMTKAREGHTPTEIDRVWNYLAKETAARIELEKLLRAHLASRH